MKSITRITAMRMTAVILLWATLPAQAQVIVHGTRQIFPGEQREISVRTENVGSRPSLVQAWVDAGDKQAGPEEADTPFILRPPVFRLDPGKSQVMRVLMAGGELAQDRESIYWLNVLDIPPTPEAGGVGSGNYLQFSLRTRIKLIYRPKGLAGSAATAPQKLQWSLVRDGAQWKLRATNPTPYYVHFSRLALRVQGKDHVADEFPMVAPMASEDYALKDMPRRPDTGNVQFEFINDQGGVAAQSVPLATP